MLLIEELVITWSGWLKLGRREGEHVKAVRMGYSVPLSYSVPLKLGY